MTVNQTKLPEIVDKLKWQLERLLKFGTRTMRSEHGVTIVAKRGVAPLIQSARVLLDLAQQLQFISGCNEETLVIEAVNSLSNQPIVENKSIAQLFRELDSTDWVVIPDQEVRRMEVRRLRGRAL